MSHIYFTSLNILNLFELKIKITKRLFINYKLQLKMIS